MQVRGPVRGHVRGTSSSSWQHVILLTVVASFTSAAIPLFCSLWGFIDTRCAMRGAALAAPRIPQESCYPDSGPSIDQSSYQCNLLSVTLAVQLFIVVWWGGGGEWLLLLLLLCRYMERNDSCCESDGYARE